MKKNLYSYGRISTFFVLITKVIELISKSANLSISKSKAAIFAIDLINMSTNYIKRVAVLSVFLIVLSQSKAQFPLFEYD